MACTDCNGSVPNSAWKRCEGCATNRLRNIMSEGRVPLRQSPKRYARNARVIVWSHNDSDHRFHLPGKVSSVKGDSYAVDLDGGGRYHAHISELKDPQSKLPCAQGKC